PDMWSHQYDQQVNQVQCTINPEHGWTTNGPESNLFGLEPNYGCCTSNMHQGWPKFVAHLWMKTADEGLVAAYWAPCRVETRLRDVPVSVQVGEEWTRVNLDKPHRELPHADFEIRPTTPWNYGLIVDRRRPEDSVSFEERPIGARPFSPDGAGIVGTARAQRIPAWKLVQGWAGELSPADIAWSDRARPVSDQPVENVTLIPYGCTNIRITEFPKVQSR